MTLSGAPAAGTGGGRTQPPFSHEAFLYGSPAEHEARCAAFLEEGLDRGEPALVALPTPRLAPLQERFARAGHRVTFLAMEDVGRNPAWLIPAWQDFAAPLLRTGRTGRGIGEPAWPGRSLEELVECARHEALLNVAFADAAGFSLLCPYDVRGLPDDVIEGARHNHPAVHGSGAAHGPGGGARVRLEVPVALTDPLPPPPPGIAFVPFGLTSLADLRTQARLTAATAGLSRQREADLAVAVTEGATNSIRHAGGGELALWVDGGRVVCEVRDRGRIVDPLHGRRRPDLRRPGGRGLWLIHQLADLVQHRHTPEGQVLRIHVG